MELALQTSEKNGGRKSATKQEDNEGRSVSSVCEKTKRAGKLIPWLNRQAQERPKRNEREKNKKNAITKENAFAEHFRPRWLCLGQRGCVTVEWGSECRMVDFRLHRWAEKGGTTQRLCPGLDSVQVTPWHQEGAKEAWQEKAKNRGVSQ